MVKMEITELEKKYARDWDEYVLKSKHFTFYHQISWENVVEVLSKTLIINLRDEPRIINKSDEIAN